MHIIETWNDLSDWCLSWAVHITWQGSLLALLALVLLLFARRWPSPLRHAILLLVLVKFIVPPFLATPTGAFSQVQLASVEVAASEQRSLEMLAPAAAPGRATATQTAAATSASLPVVDPATRLGGASDTPAASAAPTWQAWLVGVWALGAIFAALRTLVGMRALARLRQCSVSAPPELQKQFRKLVAELGIGSKPQLVVSTECVGPAAFGVIKPTVLVPQTILGMPDDELRLVLAHELVHHRRYDLVISWLQIAVSIVWWFNPLVRLVDRSIRRVREECCDDLLLARGIADRETYCQSLLRAACLMGVTNQARLSAAYNEHPMGRRFRRIMDGTRQQRSRLGLSGSAAVFTMACVALPGVGEQERPDLRSQVEVSGTVVDSSGQPVDGAHIYVGSDAQDASPRTTTAADGTFLFSCAEPKGGKPLTVVATKKGHGMQWQDVDAGKALALELTRDIAIRGQLLDQEGQPLVGAQLSVLKMHGSDTGSLDPLMAKLASVAAYDDDPMWSMLKRRFEGPGFPQAIETDTEGRFTATGLGAERAVVFLMRAEGLTTAPFTVLTRELESFTYPREGARSMLGLRTFYGAEFVYIAPPGRTVHGRAFDEQGKPLVGAQVRVQIPAGTDSSGGVAFTTDYYDGEGVGVVTPSYLSAQTGDDGRFVMTGLPQTRFSIMTVDGRAMGYLYDSVRIPNQDGKPIELEFRLSRSATVRGKVLDPDGKPVAGARVTYERAMGAVAFRRGDPDTIVVGDYHGATAEDGSYRIVVPVGKVRFSISGGSRYQPAEHQQGVMLGFFSGPVSAVLEMEAKVGDNAVNDVVLEFADTTKVAIVDPDGKPLPGCRVVGRDPMSTWSKAVPEAAIVLRGFDKDRPRLVAAYHEERNLIGVLEPESFEGEQPWRIQTQRAATIRGRLVDVDGAPRAGVRIDMTPQMGNAGRRVAGPITSLIGRTDAEGRFCLEALVPGASYTMRTVEGDIYERRWLFQGVEVKAGEVKDVGDCVGELIN